MLVEKLNYSIPEFCQCAGFSRSLFYKSVAEGWGPKTIKLGRRTVIPVVAAHKWLEDMLQKGGK